MCDLIRYRCNTIAGQTPGGEWKWRAIIEGAGGFEKILVKQLHVNVPAFSRDDDMLVAGPKYHMACRDTLRVKDGIGIIIR